jgi:hypothetical protein
LLNYLLSIYMPVVEKVKKPIVPSEEAPIAEDLSIEKPRTRKPATEAMKEAGRKNLEKGRLALQEKRKASAKPATEVKEKIDVPSPSPAPTPNPVPPTTRPRSKKVIYQDVIILQQQIDLSTLSDGIYTIDIQTLKGVLRTQVVLRH